MWLLEHILHENTFQKFQIFSVDGLLFLDLLIKLIIITTITIKFTMSYFIFILVLLWLLFLFIMHIMWLHYLMESKLHLLFPRKHIYCYSSYCVWKKGAKLQLSIFKKDLSIKWENGVVNVRLDWVYSLNQRDC